MKRETQTKLMREKIIESAIQEFNENGYEKSSLNHVCKLGGISKGIIYHYFRDKDELYLACVKACYDALLSYYLNYKTGSSDTIDIYGLIKIRILFFRDYPKFRGLFFHSIVNTPTHIQDKVNFARKELNEFYKKVYLDYLQTIQLRVTQDKALLYLDFFQNAYNEYFRKQFLECENVDELMELHENKLSEWVDIMLFGIAKER